MVYENQANMTMAQWRRLPFARAAERLGRRTRRYRPYPRKGKYPRRSTNGSSGNAFATTGFWGRPFSTPYFSRKWRPGAWRNGLMRETQFKSHYRSIEEASGILNLNSSVEDSVIRIQRALFKNAGRGGGSPFWVVDGGAQPLDIGTGVPIFQDDIILRGGIARATFFNNNTTTPIRCRIFAVWSTQYPEDKYADEFARRLEWDPSTEPEAHRFGRIVFSKEAILQPRSPMMVTYRFRPQKLDQGKFRGIDGISGDTPSASTLFWFFKASRLAPGDEDNGMVWTTSYNVAFSGDARGGLL